MTIQKTFSVEATSLQHTQSSADQISRLIKDIHFAIDPNGKFKQGESIVRMGALEATEIITFMITVAVNISTGVIASRIYDYLKVKKVDKAKISINIDEDIISIETTDLRVKISTSPKNLE